MKIILKTFFTYLLFQIISVLIISGINAGIAGTVVTVLYIVQMFLLLKIYYKTFTKDNNCVTSLKKVISMLFLSFIIFICYYLAEFGFTSFFIPSYMKNYHIDKITVLNAAIIGPFSEEIIFRGVLLNQINKKQSFMVANLIQAFVFAILHFDIYIFIFCFLFSIMMGIVCRYLNIYCCILIHSFNNILVLITMVFNIRLFEFPRITYLFIGLCFSLITLYFMIKIIDYQKQGTNYNSLEYGINNRPDFKKIK